MTRFAQIQTTSLAFAMSALIVWTAWDRGGVYYRTQVLVAMALFAFVILTTCFFSFADSGDGASGANDASERFTRFKLRAMALPSIVIVSVVIWGFSFLQSRAMPASITQAVAPGVASIYSDWISPSILKEATGLEGEALPMVAQPNAGVPLSVAPTYTRLAMLMPIAFAVVCWVLFHCFKNLYAIIVFLAVISLSGVLLSFFGLVDAVRSVAHQQMELRQFLLITPAEAGDPFGSFVNNNNAAGFLCLCFACTFGLWVLCECCFKTRATDSVTPGLRLNNGLFLTRVIGVMMLALIVAGILSSNSRGGFVGLVFGVVVVLAVFFARANKNKLKVISGFSVLVILVLLVVSLVGFGERVRMRLATLHQMDLLEDPRIGHWADAFVAAKHYFPFGAGLGTYRYAHLPFQQESGAYWFLNADGMPVEWLVEGGIWLLPLVILLLGILLRRTWILSVGFRDAPSSNLSLSDGVLRAVGAVALFAIPSLIATQLFDFGITLLPILMTFAGISAAILRASELEQSRGPQHVASPEWLRSRQVGWLGGTLRWARCFSGSFFLAWSCCALVMLWGDLRATAAVEETMLAVRRGREAGPQQMSRQPVLLARLERLALQSPENSLVWKGLAELRIVEQERLGEMDLQSLNREKPELHQSWVARQNVRQVSHDNSNSLSFQKLLLPHQSSEQWEQARLEFLYALLLNPLDDNVRVSLVELDMVTPGALIESEELLTQAAMLRPQHPAYIDYLLWLAGDHLGENAKLKIQQIGLKRELGE